MRSGQLLVVLHVHIQLDQKSKGFFSEQEVVSEERSPARRDRGVRGDSGTLPRGHPPFLLPRQGEETEEEREIPPPGVRGDSLRSRRLRRHHSKESFAALTPPQFNSWG